MFEGNQLCSSVIIINTHEGYEYIRKILYISDYGSGSHVSMCW